MLTNLAISQFTIADQLQIDLAAGMTAITGETGAGKSITLDALNMVLGARADSQVVRHNTNKSTIVAEFDIHNQPAIKDWLTEHDYATEENECILKRIITKEGRSKASINGLPVNLQNLRELGTKLVDMHSQHAHHKLLNREHHEKLLDAFAGIESDAAQVKRNYKDWQQTHQQLSQLTQQLNDAETRIEYLQFQLQEFIDLAIQPNEYVAIEKRHQQLANSDALQQTCHQALHICRTDEQSIERQLKKCLQQLDPHRVHTEAIQSITELLETANIQIEEACTELRYNLDDLNASPQELDDIEKRIRLFHDLARKHRCKPEKLSNIQKNLESELNNLAASDDQIIMLEQALEQKRLSYHQNAITLSHQRKLASSTLSIRIKEQITALGMENCQFSIALNHNPEDAKSTGYDTIEFLVSTNPGQALQPLHKIASGGELSRISLAIQVIIAETSATPVLVFDEVDVGIGGATAEVVGRLMKALAKKSQIISVTHQPQVASQADQHLVAAKQQTNEQTTTQIMHLDTPSKIKEIARMLGGLEITKRTLDHAKEMLKIAS